MIFDTHCHLFDKAFNNDLDKVLLRAKENNVTKMLVLGDDINNSKKAIALSSKYEEIYAACGIFPCECHNLSLDDSLSTLEKLLQNEKVIALGEIGLDHHWEKEEHLLKEQEIFFIEQLKLANKLNLPVSIHARDSIETVYNILKEYMPTRGAILHCYSSSKEMMYRFLKLNCFISLGGPVTFKNARVVKEVAQSVPLDRLFIETDSPYLAPSPYRGQRNEPSYLKEIINQIAQVRNMDRFILEEQIYENSCLFFRIKK